MISATIFLINNNKQAVCRAPLLESHKSPTSARQVLQDAEGTAARLAGDQRWPDRLGHRPQVQGGGRQRRTPVEGSGRAPGPAGLRRRESQSGRTQAHQLAHGGVADARAGERFPPRPVLRPQVWRIEQFRVVPWPRTKWGKLHRGDSYIVLRTSSSPANPDKLEWDIHFWIGSESSQDEYGTAAYKTVELDDFLRDGATQHREVRKEQKRKEDCSWA